jgi:hypothetical protein
LRAQVEPSGVTKLPRHKPASVSSTEVINERLFLKHTQDLRLRQRRHVADLVQKDGPAVALLEFADSPAISPREGPLLVPE